MREGFAHEARLRLDAGGDPRAPGGAITVALCGSWDHEPPCPLAAHFVDVDESESSLQLRVLFSAEPADEETVRRLIDDALASSSLVGPDGRSTTWQLLSAGPSAVRDSEADHARRLARS